VAYTWLGVVVALILIGLRFVVRSVQPALVEVQRDLEDAARRWAPMRADIPPHRAAGSDAALLTGFTLAFARGIGEYGSVVFISGNLPYQTEITPLLIVIKLTVRVQRRGSPGLLHAGDVVRDAVRDQPRAGLGRRRQVAAGR